MKYFFQTAVGFPPDHEEVQKALFHMLARPARVPYLDWGAYEIAKRVTLDHLDALPILLQEATRETIGEEKMV